MACPSALFPVGMPVDTVALPTVKSGMRDRASSGGWGKLGQSLAAHLCDPLLAETRNEREGQEALLQGHCPGQGDNPHRRLCGLPLGWPPQPTLHWPDPEHVGVMGEQHGGPSQMVLSPRRNQPWEKTQRRQGRLVSFAERAAMLLVPFCFQG